MDGLNQTEKKRVADEVIEKSIELYGLTPDEMSDKNEEWMKKRGYKRTSSANWTIESSQPQSKSSLLEKLLKHFREK